METKNMETTEQISMNFTRFVDNVEASHDCQWLVIDSNWESLLIKWKGKQIVAQNQWTI